MSPARQAVANAWERTSLPRQGLSSGVPFFLVPGFLSSGARTPEGVAGPAGGGAEAFAASTFRLRIPAVFSVAVRLGAGEAGLLNSRRKKPGCFSSLMARLRLPSKWVRRSVDECVPPNPGQSKSHR